VRCNATSSPANTCDCRAHEHHTEKEPTVSYDLPDELTVEAQDSIRIVCLNRPAKRNAANAALHRALGSVWGQLQADPEASVVVITGAGGAFCAGGDRELIERNATDPDWLYDSMFHGRRLVTEMLAFPLPVIAAVNGPAVGLGCSLALLSDIVLMADDAYMSDPHVNIGLVAADGGVLCLPLLTSMLRAKEFLLTGDRISATDAVQFGFANRAVPGVDLLSDALALAERLARQPRQALRDTKRALNMHLSRAAAGIIDFAFSAEAETFRLPDFQQSIAASWRG
jgi:enoyl-CoA hydratase